MLELPDKSPVVWQRFFRENRATVYRYVIRQINKAIEENLLEIELFKIGNVETKVAHYKSYLPILQEAMAEFVKIEDYEYANKTKKIIDAYHINKLIKESNEV